MVLNTWMDLNGDGTFNNNEEWIIRDDDVAPGTHIYDYAVPTTLPTDGPVAMRWRLGTPTSNGHDYRGDDIIGEVEDYLVPINPAAQNVVDEVPGDYDGNGFVDAADYGVWRANFGSTNPQADGNGDGIVDAADYTIWRDNLGAGNVPGGASLALAVEGTGSSDSGSNGRATRSSYVPFSLGDPMQYAGASQLDNFVANLLGLGSSGSSVNAFAATFGTMSGSGWSTSPAPVVNSVDLYFDQLDEQSDDAETGFYVDDSIDATDSVFAEVGEQNGWDIWT
jgi:hypothetical protein